PQTERHLHRLSRHWLLPDGKHGSALLPSTPCRTASRNGSQVPAWPSHRASAGAVRLDRVLDSSSMLCLVSIGSVPEPGLPPSTGVTRLRRYHEPLRLPRRPEAGTSSASVDGHNPSLCVDLSRCLDGLLNMLLPLPRRQRWILRSVAPPALGGLLLQP